MEKQKQHVGGPQTANNYDPIDRSLPEYFTDEFMMNEFKVKLCSRADPHNWTECPFTHPGEKARRRDPSKYQYNCVACPEFEEGLSCSKGDTCQYTHGLFEYLLHPDKYRKKLCYDGTKCTRKFCFFAHNPEELRHSKASTSSALPSPTSYPNSSSASAMDSSTLSSPSALIQSSSKPSWTPPAGAIIFGSYIPSSDLTNSGIQVQVHQNVKQQLRGYPSDLTNSNVVGSTQFRVDPKRSQSFIECSSASSFNSKLPSATSVALESSTSLSDWRSPDREADWSIPGDELNEMTTSYPFGFQNETSNASTTAAASNVDEPDALLSHDSWVNSLVKDDPTLESDQHCVEVEDQPQCPNPDDVPS